jgi:hypothetical protein
MYFISKLTFKSHLTLLRDSGPSDKLRGRDLDRDLHIIVLIIIIDVLGNIPPSSEVFIHITFITSNNIALDRVPMVLHCSGGLELKVYRGRLVRAKLKNLFFHSFRQIQFFEIFFLIFFLFDVALDDLQIDFCGFIKR